uniref:NADH dehydrogenase [ubiquinone] 1 beta subcomplex subunit 8, mitochondrial n=1 Tax=Phallusia mammillata TaxID=59560 RepID=A0A6F9DMQ1_9ASCI|nr:NADH dehydrogenase [ubiquinone] 1 beta subcomplex subunit 8, mitochondrial [Phallusia mammillata]
MLSLLRRSAKLYKQISRLNRPGKSPLAGIVVHRNASGLIPDGYEQFHLTHDEQVQALDNTEPLTDKKRAQLAAKYNLRPEDYVPMNDREFNVGDYPQLPLESALARDSFYDWDDKFNRRNYGEPVMWHAEMYSPVHLDTTPMIFDRPQMWKIWITFLTGFAILWALGEKYKNFLPRAPKQYPEHYPGDDMKGHGMGIYTFFEEPSSLNPKFKTRQQVTNYTFEAHPWDPEAH